MSIFKWLLLGAAMLIHLEEPVLRPDPEGLSFTVEASALLTQEMEELLAHGVEFDISLYSSLRLTKTGGGSTLLKLKKTLHLGKDLRTGHYTLSDGRKSQSFDTLGALEDEARIFRDLRFSYRREFYTRGSLFCQLRLEENPIVKDSLGMETASLWSYYKPSIERSYEVTEY